ncbi:N-acetylmuramoyl-L-alanine amidase [Caldicoprobacter guelmensis]|uniref:N-acetylmuramoyl-L-alanine amidase CwlD n=1 Tax=Caldicoprobacter guelmensis TaxID=1170224 RepID=UPI00195BD4A1|nr:N-acetylmuramoyl-L-alanine amidase CwlD [Caldicoprobacter guelmensis]MBM7581609.1 N-acetylmuramoyl-L-alanine amidase [Caldicoprobacter guelmensis]
MRVIFITKKWLIVFWVLLGLILFLLFALKSKEDSAILTLASPVSKKVIVIDAGHGGFDPGAVSNSGTREDRINLLIAKKLKKHLENQGATVIMTRQTDEALGRNKREDMQRRVEIIRNSNADIVVSIHLNKFRQSKYYGAQTFYMSGSEEGKRLAQCIQTQLIKVLNRGNTRQIKAVNDLLILKAGQAPSVVVECGFLSNPQEERLLRTDEYQEQVAWAIYCGIVDYFIE